MSGLIVGDPCNWDDPSPKACCRKLFYPYKRGPEIVGRVMLGAGDRGGGNGAEKTHEADFFVLMGDNFYDDYGNLTSRFFQDLPPRVQEKQLLTVVGNHDYHQWPGLPNYAGDGQRGYGFAQFFIQDSQASYLQDVSKPFDLAPTPADHPNCKGCAGFGRWNPSIPCSSRVKLGAHVSAPTAHEILTHQSGRLGIILLDFSS